MNQKVYTCISPKCDATERLIFSFDDFDLHQGEGHLIHKLQNLQKILTQNDLSILNNLRDLNLDEIFQQIDNQKKKTQTELDNALNDITKSYKECILAESNEISEILKLSESITQSNIDILRQSQSILPNLFSPDEKLKEKFTQKNQKIKEIMQEFQGAFEEIRKNIHSLKFPNKIDHQQSFKLEIDQYSQDCFQIDEQKKIKLQEWLKKDLNSLKLIYRGTRDGFRSEDFHKLCDNKGPTLSIIKSEHNLVFGGYTTQSWRSTGDFEYSQDEDAFIFSLTKQTKHPISYKQRAICHIKNRLVQFGGVEGWCDIALRSQCNIKESCFTHFPSSFQGPSDMNYVNSETMSYLAGSYEFKIHEIEVYQAF